MKKITTTRISWVVALFLIASLIGWAVTFIFADNGWAAPVLGVAAVITMTAVAVLLIVLGVRVLRDRAKPVAARMNPLAAARTLVLAQAGAYAGVMLAGWHAGILVHRVPLVGMDSGVTVDAALMTVSGLALTAIGLVVEQWCKVPPDEEDSAPEESGAPAS